MDLHEEKQESSEQRWQKDKGQQRETGLGPQRGPQESPHTIWIWLAVLIGLMIWNFIAFWPKESAEIQIPYSTFLDQVRADNISKVTISGDAISGSFQKPFKWPQTSPQPPKPETPTQGGGQAQPRFKELPASKGTSPARTVSSDYTEFKTLFPQAVGDQSLMPLLEERKVVIEAQSPPSHWFMFLVTDGLPLLLLVLFFVWIGRQATQRQSGIFSFGRSKARQYSADQPAVTFADVAGVDEAKAELEEEVDFLRHPQKYHELGARIPRGILLVGPPGTGKTLLARAVAGEAGVPFFSISASEFVEMFVGVGASRVRDLFEKAKASAPAIVFIDELDAVGRRRGAGLGQTNDEREQTLNQLLVEMDGFDVHHEAIVLAATNRPDVLDPALLRPGRFDREVVVSLPEKPAREGILRIHTRQLRLARDVDFDLLARTTTGFSGADLANLCNEAALVAARRSHGSVERGDFEEALDKIVLGEARPHLQEESERRLVAYHESGHALVAWFTPEADPVHKVTIIPHGRALGVTAQLPSEERHNYSRTYLLARLAVMLGGRTAEEIVIGDITTGAENDLLEATRLARRMIARWGMGSLGPVAFKADEEQPFLGYELAQGKDFSEATANLIDQEVARMLEERHQAAFRILNSKREGLDRLVAALLKGETIRQEDLTDILGPRAEGRHEGTGVKPVETPDVAGPIALERS